MGTPPAPGLVTASSNIYENLVKRQSEMKRLRKQRKSGGASGAPGLPCGCQLQCGDFLKPHWSLIWTPRFSNKIWHDFLLRHRAIYCKRKAKSCLVWGLERSREFMKFIRPTCYNSPLPAPSSARTGSWRVWAQCLWGLSKDVERSQWLHKAWHLSLSLSLSLSF